MKKNFTLGALVCLALFSNFSWANPCSIDTENDLASSNNNPLREVAAQDVDSACTIDDVDIIDYFPDSSFANSWIYFLTPELCDIPDTSCPGIAVRKITLSVKEGSNVLPINFNVKENTTLLVGNYSNEMLLDTGSLYTTAGKIGTANGLYHDGDGDGKIDDTGFVIVDGSGLEAGTSPFACTSSSASVYIRNMVVVTNGVPESELFTGCIKNGGAVRVCDGKIKSGFESGNFDPDTDDWCESNVSNGNSFDFSQLKLTPLFPYCLDTDQDGYYTFAGFGRRGGVLCSTVVRGDCNDDDKTINPAVTEISDGIDNDCDDEIDEGLVITVDADGDGYDSIETGGTDCDDGNAAIYVGATETCDEVDNNCDDAVDEGDVCITTDLTDADSDGSLSDVDCNDANATVYPSAAELCDGIDNDCDGVAEGSFDAMVSDAEFQTLIGTLDADMDGLSNSAEFELATSPFVADTDGDGVGDLEQINTEQPNWIFGGVSCMSSTEACEGGVDEDNDGKVDCGDSDCYGAVLNDGITTCPDLSINQEMATSSGCGCYLGEVTTVNFSSVILGVMMGLGMMGMRISKNHVSKI